MSKPEKIFELYTRVKKTKALHAEAIVTLDELVESVAHEARKAAAENPEVRAGLIAFIEAKIQDAGWQVTGGRWIVSPLASNTARFPYTGGMRPEYTMSLEYERVRSLANELMALRVMSREGDKGDEVSVAKDS